MPAGKTFRDKKPQGDGAHIDTTTNLTPSPRSEARGEGRGEGFLSYASLFVL